MRVDNHAGAGAVRGPIAEALMLSANLIRFRMLATRRDWRSHRLYVMGGIAASTLTLMIFVSTYAGVRTLVAANATGLVFSIALWAFLVYLFTDLFIAFGQALNDMYLSSDMPILLVMPVRASSLVVAKFALGVAQNEVYAAVFLLPFVLGYLAGLGAPWWAYPVSLAGLALFPAVLYAVLSAITIVTLRVIPPRGAKEMLWVVGAAVPTAFWLLSFSKVAHLEGDVTSLQLPVTPAWLPSTWVGDLLAFAGAGDAGRALAWLALIAAVTLVVCPLALSVVSIGFAEGWSRSASAKRGPAVSSGAPPVLNPVAAIVWKDVSSVLRSPQLWFNHIASLGFIGYLLIGHQVQTPLLPLTVQLAMLQVGFVAVLDGLNPGMTALSLEHRCIWLLKGAPLTARQIFTAKLWSAYAQTALICVVAALALGAGYRFGPGDIVALVAFALLMSAASICYGLAFDTRFPSFDWENPNAINRGVRMIVPFLNGLLALALCGAILGATRVELHGLWQDAAGPIVGLLASAVVVLFVVDRTSRQAVRNIEALEL